MSDGGDSAGGPAAAFIASMATAAVTDMAAGKGSTRALVTAAEGARNLEVRLNRVRAGHPAAPYHLHRVAEDVYVVLRGVALVLFEGQPPARVRPGEVVFIPPGVPHALGGDGDSDVWLLEIYAPSAQGDFDLVEAPGARAEPTPVADPASASTTLDQLLAALDR